MGITMTRRLVIFSALVLATMQSSAPAQTVATFNTTVRGNILMGLTSEEVDDDRVWEALAAGAEVRAGAGLIGQVTSAEGGEGLALIRTDRFAKAMQAAEAVSVNEAAAEIETAPWLAAELKALMEAADE
jgi:folate-binding Fe-S cluster repair protein YgfZ